MKKNYLDYLDDALSKRSLCIQIKLNLCNKNFNENIDMIENISSKKNIFLIIIKGHNFSFI